jgi:hypothetical protein
VHGFHKAFVVVLMAPLAGLNPSIIRIPPNAGLSEEDKKENRRDHHKEHPYSTHDFTPWFFFLVIIENLKDFSYVIKTEYKMSID